MNVLTSVIDNALFNVQANQNFKANIMDHAIISIDRKTEDKHMLQLFTYFHSLYRNRS